MPSFSSSVTLWFWALLDACACPREQDNIKNKWGLWIFLIRKSSVGLELYAVCTVNHHDNHIPYNGIKYQIIENSLRTMRWWVAKTPITLLVYIWMKRNAAIVSINTYLQGSFCFQMHILVLLLLSKMATQVNCPYSLASRKCLWKTLNTKIVPIYNPSGGIHWM